MHAADSHQHCIMSVARCKSGGAVILRDVSIAWHGWLRSCVNLLTLERVPNMNVQYGCRYQRTVGVMLG